MGVVTGERDGRVVAEKIVDRRRREGTGSVETSEAEEGVGDVLGEREWLRWGWG